jgi:KTSC domain
MPLDHKVFQSSMLERGSYNSDTQSLQVTFANGHTYEAQDVPASVWQALKQASSPGRHYHREVKPYYNFTET